MAISETDVLLLQKGQNGYILLASSDRYHLIHGYKSMSDRKKKKLYSLYPCEEQTFQELGIKVTTILKKNIYGFRSEGNTAGSEFLLRVLGQNTKKYTLLKDVAPEILATMFEDVRVLQPPRDNAPDAWRKKEQDPATLKAMKRVRLVFIFLAAISFVFIKSNPQLWGTLLLFVPIICVILANQYPVYFTFLDGSGKRKPKYGIGLSILFICSLIALSLHYLYIDYLSFLRFFLMSAVAGAVISVAMWIFVGELRGRIGYFVVTCLLVVVLGGWGVVGHLNGLLDSSPERILTYTVMDLEHTVGSKGADFYECIIILETGEKFSVSLDEETFASLSVGDTVRIARKEGGLGLAYMYYVED